MYQNSFHTEDISKSSFLITGGAGFIGSHIAEYLMKFNAGKIRVLDNLENGYLENIQAFVEAGKVEFIEGDIKNIDTCQEACKGIDYVFHEAALGSVPRSVANPSATNDTNVSGFLNVLVAAKDNQVKRVVYASSSSVYGDSKTMPKVEAQIGKPLSPYAVSKLTNELYADVFVNTYKMEIIGLRYFNVFGPRQSPNGAYAAAIPLFMDALLKNKAPYINGDGEQTRDFTFVENAVQANIKAMFTKEAGAVGEVYNVAVGDRISINRLFNILKKLAKADIDAIHRENRPGDVRDSLADLSKSKKLLGYEAQINVEDGLAETIKWFKQQSVESL